jgi:hypothetical protein
MYVGIEENEAYYESLENDEDEDIFGFSKAIEIDHLTDEEVEEVFDMFGDK